MIIFLLAIVFLSCFIGLYLLLNQPTVQIPFEFLPQVPNSYSNRIIDIAGILAGQR